jgi:hypothetical protein
MINVQVCLHLILKVQDLCRYLLLLLLLMMYLLLQLPYPSLLLNAIWAPGKGINAQFVKANREEFIDERKDLPGNHYYYVKLVEIRTVKMTMKI